MSLFFPETGQWTLWIFFLKGVGHFSNTLTLASLWDCLFISLKDLFILFAVYEHSACLYVYALSLLLKEKVLVEEGECSYSENN